MSWFLKSAAITLLTLAPPPRVNAFLRAAPAAVGRRPSRREAETSSDAPGAASRVVILGGGFGGLYTALRLAEFSKEQPVEITLVDSKDKFVFLPLLYELTTGQVKLGAAEARDPRGPPTAAAAVAAAARPPAHPSTNRRPRSTRSRRRSTRCWPTRTSSSCRARWTGLTWGAMS